MYGGRLPAVYTDTRRPFMVSTAGYLWHQTAGYIWGQTRRGAGGGTLQQHSLQQGPTPAVRGLESCKGLHAACCMLLWRVESMLSVEFRLLHGVCYCCMLSVVVVVSCF